MSEYIHQSLDAFCWPHTPRYQTKKRIDQGKIRFRNQATLIDQGHPCKQIEQESCDGTHYEVNCVGKCIVLSKPKGSVSSMGL